VKPQTAAAPDPRENGDLPWRELVLRYVAAAAGTLLRWIYGAGLLAIAGLVSRWPWIGNVVTGLIIGRGANFVDNFASRWPAPGR
jgi:hypothetical protein